MSQGSFRAQEVEDADGQLAAHSPSTQVLPPMSPEIFQTLDFSFDPTFLEVDNTLGITLQGQRTPSGSSILEEDAYVDLDGRTYHAYTQGSYYFLPNDGAEQDRLDLQHKAFVLLLGGALSLAPISHPVHVLDVATGTGIWALEFAEQNPSSHVIGTDMSFIQPVPRVPSCEFIREDSEFQEWIYDHGFDLKIHMRAVITCFDDFKTIMKKS